MHVLGHGQPGRCHLHWPATCCCSWLSLFQLGQSTSACTHPPALCYLHAASSSCQLMMSCRSTLHVTAVARILMNNFHHLSSHLCGLRSTPKPSCMYACAAHQLVSFMATIPVHLVLLGCAHIYQSHRITAVMSACLACKARTSTGCCVKPIG